MTMGGMITGGMTMGGKPPGRFAYGTMTRESSAAVELRLVTIATRTTFVNIAVITSRFLPGRATTAITITAMTTTTTTMDTITVMGITGSVLVTRIASDTVAAITGAEVVSSSA